MSAIAAKQLVNALCSAGLKLELTLDQRLKVTPSSKITSEIRALIQENKPSLITWLQGSAANDGIHDPDRWCWPMRGALSTAEIDRLTTRLALFTDRGLSVVCAEPLVDKLAVRDRDGDDRRMCLECSHMVAHAGSWRCRAWERSTVATTAWGAGMGGDEVMMLRRCNGFASQLENSTPRSSTSSIEEKRQ